MEFGRVAGGPLINPKVRINRDDKTEAAVVTILAKKNLCCFMCGVIVENSTQQNPRYVAQQIDKFKGLLREADPSKILNLGEGGICGKCLGTVRNVWDMEQEISAIKNQVDEVVKDTLEMVIALGKANRVKISEDLSPSKARDEETVCSEDYGDNAAGNVRNMGGAGRIDDENFGSSSMNIQIPNCRGSSDILMTSTDNSSAVISSRSLRMGDSDPSPPAHSESDQDEGSAEADYVPNPIFKVETIILTSDDEMQDDDENNDEWRHSPAKEINNIFLSETNGGGNTRAKPENKEQTSNAVSRKQRMDKTRYPRCLKSHHGLRQFKCHNCGKIVLGQVAIVEHVRSAHGGGFPCSVCGKELSSPTVCAVHEVTLHNFTSKRAGLDMLGITMKKCEFNNCGKKFHRKKDLLKHAATHTPQRYQCSTCGKRYADKKSCRVHEGKCFMQPTAIRNN